MTKVLFRDILFLMLLAFVAIIVWMLPHIQDAKKKIAEGDPSPGNLTVYISWPPGDTDVDLWVTGPGEPVPIGYSNKGGVLWNLLRDDLGLSPDLGPANFENSYSRGIPAGDWAINVHCYRCPVVPVPVHVEVRLAEPGEGSIILFTTSLELKMSGQERTVARFETDATGHIVPDSMDFTFIPLRAGGLGNGMGGYGIPPQ